MSTLSIQIDDDDQEIPAVVFSAGLLTPPSPRPATTPVWSGLPKNARLHAPRGATVPAEFPRFASQCIELLQLEDGWDSYGSKPIASNIVDSVLSYVWTLLHAGVSRPQLVPSSSGGVQLEWRQESQILEAEFVEPDLVEILIDDGTSDREFALTGGAEELIRLVKDFLASGLQQVDGQQR